MSEKERTLSLREERRQELAAARAEARRAAHEGRGAFSPDGKLIWGPTVKVWDARSGQEARTLKGHTGIVVSVAFSPDGKRIMSGGGDSIVKVWDASP